jgi:FdhD protein
MISTSNLSIQQVDLSGVSEKIDQLAVEEPLEIRLDTGGRIQSVSITMRTPGNDFELAAGFLFTEGILQSPDQIEKIGHPTNWNPDLEGNVVVVKLKEGIEVDTKKLERHFYTTSSCGVCGKASIDAVKATGLKKLPTLNDIVPANLIHQLPERLRQQQQVFDQTGGLHAAALFDTSGKLELLKEDVGRHNAVDKLIGASFLAEQIPLHERIILVSGRASFELIQKAAMAQIPILAAVGAPSSLAISLAEEVGMTVLGFVRDGRYNIYCGAERLNLS